ncbi:hypothetical protein BC941DRAFT_442779, partial [Chlamydoabsidia padenii]
MCMVLGLLLFSSSIFYSASHLWIKLPLEDQVMVPFGLVNTSHLWIKSWYLLVWSSLFTYWYQEIKRNRICMVLGLLFFSFDLL